MKSENWRNKKISLILPTYNERESIREVIDRFNELGIFHEIIVVNNNASPGTSEEVAKTDAIEVFEEHQGYGAAILRGFMVAQGDLVGVCEPDNTFAEKDIFKLLSYADSFDVVYGSRTMNDLIWDGANMGWFLRFGNWSVAKLMQILFNSCSLTDVGCTFRLIRRMPMLKVIEKARVTSNFFGPEMMLLTILMKMKVVQIPVNYKDRIGISSVTGSARKALLLGIQMIWLILTTRMLSWNTHSYLSKKTGAFAHLLEKQDQTRNEA